MVQLGVRTAPMLLFTLLIPFRLSGSVSAAAATGERQIRYVDVENGRDEPECLGNASTSLACQNISYALLRPEQPLTNLELRIKPGTYYYSNETDGGLSLRNATNVTLRGEGPGPVVLRCREYIDDDFRYDNLAFFGGRNVEIVGLIVENCGALPAGIYVRSVEEISLINCTFRNNSGGGIWMVNAGKVLVENCIFIDNVGMRPDFRADIVFDLQTHNSGGLGLLYTNISQAVATLHNCTFLSNKASRNPRNANDARPQAYVPYGHGGALIVRLSDYTDGANITVSDCVFKDNRALFSGGAVYIVLIGHTSNNRVLFHNSSFISSIADHTGGAISIQVFDVEENNAVTIENSSFTSCSANEGGGAISLIVEDSLGTTSLPTDSDPTLLTVRGSEFTENRSPTGGSAVGLVSNARIDRVSFVNRFQDCTFTSNVAESQGAFLTFRFRVEFSGTMLFSGNEGGAMLVFQTKVDVGGSLVFTGNRARMGGAVTLEDQSWFNLLPGTDVIFSDNEAETVGGAILVNNPSIAQDFDPVYNTDCFFQSDRDKALTPDSWNVSISFINNTAGTAGAAIFAANITVCTFTSPTCSDQGEYRTTYQGSIFTKTPFIFDGNTVTQSSGEVVVDVATEASNLTIQQLRDLSSPGERVALSLQAYDQCGNKRSALWRLQTQSSQSQSFTYSSLQSEPTSDYTLTLEPVNVSLTTGQRYWSSESESTGDNDSLQFFVIEELSGEVVYKERVDINVSYCHPGYEYSSEKNTCILSDFPHVLRPDDNNLYIYLSPRYYAGFYEDRFYAVSLMPQSFQNCSRDGTRSGCLYQFDQPDKQCKGGGNGFMCGSCPKDKGVDLTLRTCRKCNWVDVFVPIVVFVLVIVFSLLVMLFNIGVPNDLKGFLFFAQVVGFVYRHGSDSDELNYDFHLSRLLGFSIYLPVCPFTALPALGTAAFSLIPCLLAILTVAVYVICARVIRTLGNVLSFCYSARVIRPLGNKTVFRGIWLIILFVYKYVGDTVTTVLKCVALEGDEVERGTLVFYYDGNVPCYRGDHLWYAIPALLLLLLVVLPGPALIILISFRRFKMTQVFTDVITDGVRLNTRWWGGFDLLRRLMFIATVTVMDSAMPDYSQLSLCLVSVAVLGVLCFSKPYTQPYINLIEAFILLDLVIISFIFLNSKEAAQVDPAVFQILLLLPFIYAVINIVCKITVFLWKKYSPMGVKQMLQSLWERLSWSGVGGGGGGGRDGHRPRGLLVKSASLERGGDGSVVEVEGVLGEEGVGEGWRPEDAQYSLYREELLDT